MYRNNFLFVFICIYLVNIHRLCKVVFHILDFFEWVILVIVYFIASTYNELGRLFTSTSIFCFALICAKQSKGKVGCIVQLDFFSFFGSG